MAHLQPLCGGGAGATDGHLGSQGAGPAAEDSSENQSSFVALNSENDLQYYPVEQLSCQQELICAEYFSMCIAEEIAASSFQAKPNLGKRTSTCSWVTRRSDGSSRN